jgi:hypothetical protein
MVSITEAQGYPHRLQATLDAGLDNLDQQQSVVFTKYLRVVLPLDGFVFWVKASLVSPSAMLNMMQLNQSLPDRPAISGGADTITVKGSFHYSVQRRQLDDQTLDVNSCVFTSQSSLEDFNYINPQVMYLGMFNKVRFSFSQRGNFFQQASLWHYVGDAIYPDMETQIIDTVNGFDLVNPVVSNSLPIWLAMNQMTPPFPYPPTRYIPLYPSMLVPDDIYPPWGAVDVEATEALGTTPYIDAATSSHYQLAQDTVKITFFGLRNFSAMDFVDYVNYLSLQYDAPFGIMNVPVVQDEKKIQAEMSVIAQKKSVTYEITYNQYQMRNIAQAFIKRVIPNYIIGA